MKQSVTAILITSTLATLASPLTVQAQDKAAAKPADKPASEAAATPKGKPTTITEINEQFSNLPKETRAEFGKKLIKLQNLFNQKRIFDAFEKIDELDKIFPNHPASLNIKGACYVEIRAFDKANVIFTELIRISPNNTSVLFNLAEVDFVTKNWASAEKLFTEILTLLPAEQKAMIRLCEFKLLLCQLKLGKKEEAIVLKDKYDVWDDSPFYYFSRAAIAYEADDKIGAEKHLRNVRFIWRNDAALAAWQDTLIEFGYIRSFYGGDTTEAK